MESEVRDLGGERSRPDTERGACRWGTETGFCVIDGQRVPVERPRVRSRPQNREVALGSYELFQRASLMEENVWQKIMHGLTMRSWASRRTVLYTDQHVSLRTMRNFDPQTISRTRLAIPSAASTPEGCGRMNGARPCTRTEKWSSGSRPPVRSK